MLIWFLVHKCAHRLMLLMLATNLKMHMRHLRHNTTAAAAAATFILSSLIIINSCACAFRWLNVCMLCVFALRPAVVYFLVIKFERNGPN